MEKKLAHSYAAHDKGMTGQMQCMTVLGNSKQKYRPEVLPSAHCRLVLIGVAAAAKHVRTPSVQRGIS